ncbi:MAG: YdcF family protein [Candidatus Acidiferrales bacterium]
MPLPRDNAMPGEIITVKTRAESRREYLQVILPVTALVLLAAAIVVFRGAGRWLVHEDPLRQADVIVVLSGSMPARAEEAARILQAGYAPDVWVTRPESPSELSQMGIQYVGEEEYSRQVLIHEGVQQAAIRVLPDPSIDTEQEIDEISLQMRLEDLHTAIVVTSPEHTRRVKTLWSKLVGKDPAIIVRGAPQDGFDADRWWSNTRDAFSVVREMMGLTNAWFGLPVRPHSS